MFSYTLILSSQISPASLDIILANKRVGRVYLHHVHDNNLIRHIRSLHNSRLHVWKRFDTICTSYQEYYYSKDLVQFFTLCPPQLDDVVLSDNYGAMALSSYGIPTFIHPFREIRDILDGKEKISPATSIFFYVDSPIACNLLSFAFYLNSRYFFDTTAQRCCLYGPGIDDLSVSDRSYLIQTLNGRVEFRNPTRIDKIVKINGNKLVNLCRIRGKNYPISEYRHKADHCVLINDYIFCCDHIETLARIALNQRPYNNIYCYRTPYNKYIHNHVVIGDHTLSIDLELSGITMLSADEHENLDRNTLNLYYDNSINMPTLLDKLGVPSLSEQTHNTVVKKIRTTLLNKDILTSYWDIGDTRWYK